MDDKARRVEAIRLQASTSGDVKILLAHIDTLEERLHEIEPEITRLREVTAEAHALRCDCVGPRTRRDPRCVEIQNLVT